MKEKALSCAGLRDLRLTFSLAWLRNFVAACGLACSTAAYDGGFGVYKHSNGVVTVVCLTAWLRWLYEKTRLPLIPIYGGFPVKMMYASLYLHVMTKQ